MPIERHPRLSLVYVCLRAKTTLVVYKMSRQRAILVLSVNSRFLPTIFAGKPCLFPIKEQKRFLLRSLCNPHMQN